MKNQFTTIVFLAGAVLGSMPLHAEDHALQRAAVSG
jgi:hypothetical protein